MKKIIISLQFFLLCCILVISSITFYCFYSESKQTDLDRENEHFIEEMYVQDNLTASVLCDNSPVDIDELKSVQPRIVCYYSSQSCAACLNYAKERIREIFSKHKETRPHTDGFRRNNAKCLESNGICSVVPYSSFSGF